MAFGRRKFDMVAKKQCYLNLNSAKTTAQTDMHFANEIFYGNYILNRILFLIFCMSVIFLINYQSSYVFTENIGVIQHQTQVYHVYYFETSYDVIF